MAIRTVGFTEKQPDLTDVYNCLEYSIHSFNHFHHENYDLLKQRGEELLKALAPGAESLTGAGDPKCCEIENTLKAVLELRKDSEKLHWYYRDNKEAVRRVYAKLEKLCSLTGQIDGGHKAEWVKLEADRDESWLKYTRSLNELMGSILQIRSYMKLHSETKSCLENVSSHHSLPSDPFRALNRAVIDDEAPELSRMLEAMHSNNTTTRLHFQELVRDLACRSVTCRSKQVAGYLLSQAFPQHHIALDQEILNQLIIVSGRQRISEEPTTQKMCSQCTPKASCGESEDNLFTLAFKQLGRCRKHVLFEKDAFGHLPLHYSAYYGLPGICEMILNLSQSWGQEYTSRLIMSTGPQRHTPLHYAVINNHAVVIKVFLKTLEATMQASDEGQNYELFNILNDILVVAIRYQHDDIVRLLAKFPLNSHDKSSHGETALYAAARSGNEEYVDLLLEHGRYSDVDVPETVHGWTLLFVACVEGHRAVVNLLLNAGAKQGIHDYLGWTAKEHAAFMHASNIQSLRENPVSVLGEANAQPMSTQITSAKPRSRSLTKDYERGSREIRDRMKYTVDVVSKGFKPNTRGDFIQDSFTTLEELLEELPESISFNIEIKYPRLHEAIEAGVAPVAIEINTFIDKALERLFSYGNKKRTIILSSFTPEICILLAIKQQTYPVMFITNAGKPPVTDREMRAASIQSAVRFAKRWNLSGLVFASEALVMCPRLVRYVQRSGLLCGSYGSQNNIPENAKAQAAAGIDIIMADKVGLIAMSLKGYQKQAKSQA
ncbi:Glycerophosphodiester phosphodiesterase domain protein [Aspergillus parasiticus SU-1]|uniref:Glycerophosphodiester phosphodiesterase domain protein n=1 Tax=Aspergillus parasiticus (strain ATCC 56775 / NRRL 5862 / SRRC 143 / SU-1) TaxID=1403190 RepID=A0A0F0I119_ASPPU|nr:Glycerophosphodiester phosphodiesterase domain protein [Aspergillus parasiticus SU-1]